MDVPPALAKAAASAALLLNADAVVVSGEVVCGNCEILKELSTVSKKIIISIETDSGDKFASFDHPVVQVPLKPESREMKMELILATCLREGKLSKGEKVIYVDQGAYDSFSIHYKMVNGEERIFLFEEPVISAIDLALYIANTTYNNMRVGAAFTIGDSKAVLRMSHQLAPDSLPRQFRDIRKRENYPVITKIAAMNDGAFVVDSSGFIKACCRHLDANRKVNLPGPLGSRHYAVAAMTCATKAIGVVVSQEDGHVRVFRNGEVVLTIHPSRKVVESKLK